MGWLKLNFVSRMYWKAFNARGVWPSFCEQYLATDRQDSVFVCRQMRFRRAVCIATQRTASGAATVGPLGVDAGRFMRTWSVFIERAKHLRPLQDSEIIPQTLTLNDATSVAVISVIDTRSSFVHT